MTDVFQIRSSLEALQKEGISYMAGRVLRRRDGGDDVHLVNFQEGEIIDRTLGKRPEQYPEIAECDYSESYSANLDRKIVYGHYRPRYGADVSHDSAKSVLHCELGKWLVSFSADVVSSVGLRIEDIELISKPVPATCPHCDDAHDTNFVAFVAMVAIPANICLDAPGGEPLVAFLRDHDTDLVTDLYSREGLYVFNLEETDIPCGTELSLSNWRSYAELDKAIVFAQYF